MRRTFFTVLPILLIILLFSFVSCVEETKLIPMEDFFKNPQQAYFQISPDGKYVSFTKPYERRMNIFVQAIGSEDVTRVTSVTDRDIWSYWWKGDNRILYSQDFGGDENFHIFGVDPDGGNLTDLTPFEGVRAKIVDDMPDHDTDILVSLNKSNPEVFDVYRLNTVTGELTLVAKNPGNISGWMTDHDYNVRIAMRTDGINNTILYRDSSEGEFREIMTIGFKDTFHPMLFTFDNKYVYALSNLGRDREVIVKYDIANNVEMELLYEHPEVDVAGLSYSRKRKVLTVINYVDWKHQRKFLDPETEKYYKILEERFPGYETYLTSNNRNEDIFIARTMSDRTTGSYYLFDTRTGEITKLADRNPWLPENQLAEMKPITYKSRDGLTIHGYLTVPKGVEAKNLPIVVNPHGGPWARDSWGFRGEVQFLANRGFAVFQMNFRGSVGYGKAFWETSFKQWGKKMQDDITDGVKWLINEGIADPDRIAIYGGSYGGYATLAGLAFTPDLYACGVDYVGVSNLFTFMNTMPPYWELFRQMMYEMVGDPVKDSVLLVEASPVFHVDNIKVPVLVAQGANDPRVNIDESNQIVDALKKRGIEVVYMVKDNEGHGFSNEENRFDFYRAMEKFLTKQLLSKK
ncbi:MAG: S9 family peptidase [candidate division Zixibacteria bacterium]|nr:S9 family peptidase [candidate division Zixibacteria bacterium]